MGKISVHDKIVIKNFRQRKDRISKFLHELPCKGELMHHGVLTSHLPYLTHIIACASRTVDLFGVTHLVTQRIFNTM